MRISSSLAEIWFRARAKRWIRVDLPEQGGPSSRMPVLALSSS